MKNNNDNPWISTHMFVNHAGEKSWRGSSGLAALGEVEHRYDGPSWIGRRSTGDQYYEWYVCGRRFSNLDPSV